MTKTVEKIIAKSPIKPVPYWRQLWKAASVWFMAAAAVAESLQYAIQTTWLGLPPDLKQTLTHGAAYGITMALLILGIVSRFVKQDAIKTEK